MATRRVLAPKMDESGLTPIASSRRSKSEATSYKGKNVRWSLSQDKGPSNSPSVREPPSPDMIGKLSLALNNMRNLKDKLTLCEAELATAREEKEKYAQEHAKIYQQLTSIRTKCSVFEAQLARKATENEAFKERKEQMEEELTHLRKIASDDMSKQTSRIKSLELQVNALKCELANKNCDINSEAASLRMENNRLTSELETIRKEYSTNLQRLTLENTALHEQIKSLVAKNDENRSSIVKLTGDKMSLTQEIDRFRQEAKRYMKNHKEIKRVAEMEERLAELETERTNAKMALKKAMAVLDQEDALREAIEERDRKISALEEELEKLRIYRSTGESSIPRSVITKNHHSFNETHDARSIINQRLDEIQETKARLKQLTGRSTAI